MKEQVIELMISLKTNIFIFFGVVVGLLAPIKYMLLLVGIFIIIDTIFGIYAAKKNKIKITSSRLSKIISKMFVYQATVILMFFLDVNLIGEFLFYFIDIKFLLTKVTAIMLIVNEFYSVDEKLRMVNNERGIWFYFKRLIGLTKHIKKEVKQFENKDN